MASMDSFKNIWEDAVARYEAQSQRKIDRDVTFQKYNTLQDLEEYVNKRRANFSSFRERHGKLFSRMSRCFKPLMPVLDMVQKGIAASPYAPAAIAFGAAWYLLQACESVTSCYDTVEELFDQIGNITVRLREYEHSTMEASLKAKMADVLVFILEIIGKTEKVVRRKRVKQWAKSLFLEDDEISPSLMKLRKFVQDELGLVVALTYARVGELQSTVEDLRKGVSEIQSTQRTERLRAFNEGDEKRLSEALMTEAIHQISIKQQQNAEALTKGTGLWIKDDPMFQAWEEENGPVLWILGPPGVGKTMLATRTIEILKADFPQHPDNPSLTSVSYLYFKNDDPELQDCTKMWKAAAAQIVATNDQFKKHVLSVLKRDNAFATPRRAWELLFLDFFAVNKFTRGQTSLAFIIVDGLDEAPESQRIEFLACLAELTKRITEKISCRIQVAIFARPDVHADVGFEKIGSHQSGRIVVTSDRNSHDVSAFVKQKLGEVRVLKDLRKRKPMAYKRLAKEIYTTVLDRSQGMFLWASLVFPQIRDLSSSEAVKASLAQAPPKLDSMLHHVFKRFDTDEEMQRSYLQDLLMWVLCTYRPLYVSELFVLVRMTTNQECVSVYQDVHTRYASIFHISEPMAEHSKDTVLPDQEEASELTEDDFEFLSDTGPDNDSEREPSLVDSADDDAASKGPDAADGEIISDIWRASRVTFTHAWVRDYLNTECNPKTRRWNDCTILTHDLNESKLRIFKSLIDILRTDVIAKFNVPGLLQYAQANWAKHLVDIDCGDPGSALSISLARILADLFNDGVAFRKSSYWSTTGFIATWFETNRYTGKVRRLISDHLKYLDQHHHEWAKRVQSSTRALFEAMVSECAATWLARSGWDDPKYLGTSLRESWILYAFNSLQDKGIDEEHAPDFSDMDFIPLEDIETVANLLSLPKTEHWYTGVAWVMTSAKQAEHTKRAMQYFQKAIEMRDGAWVALQGLAVCHGAALGDFGKAVQLLNEAIEKLPQTKDYSGVDFSLRAEMGAFQRQLGDPMETLRITRAAYEGSFMFEYPTGHSSDHYTLLSIKNYIQALYDSGHQEDILRLAQDLDSRITGDEGRSLWIVFLREQYDYDYDANICDKMRTISRQLGRERTVPVIRDSVERAVPLQPEQISCRGNLWLFNQLTRWLYEVAETPDCAISLCERLNRTIDEAEGMAQQSSDWHRDTTASILAGHYLAMAITAKSVEQDFQASVSKLDRLACHRQGSKKYVTPSYPALCMGEWLHEYVRAEDKEWMAYIRPSITRALHLLSDNDPWDDQVAYAQLGRALLFANDIQNACIALGITVKPLEEASENAAAAEEEGKAPPSETQYQTHNKVHDQDNAEPHNPKYAGFWRFWNCDNCVASRDPDEDPFQELHVCRLCDDTCFCEKCIRLLKSDGLEYMTCSKEHEHVRVFPMTKEAREITDALLEKRFEVQEEWLNRLWKTWADQDANASQPP